MLLSSVLIKGKWEENCVQKRRLKHGRPKNQTNHGTGIKKLYSSDCLPAMIDRVMLKIAASVSPSKMTGEHASLAPIPSEQQYDD